MKAQRLRALLTAVANRLALAEDELRDLDAAIGDGDLGITVRAASKAAIATLAGMARSASPVEIIRCLASAIASANPSTFGALVAGGMIAGAKAIDGTNELGRNEILAFGRAAAQAIGTKGRSAVGDKTILDALVPSLDALEAAAPDNSSALDLMIGAAKRGIDETKALPSKRGRAAWMGDRTKEHSDPGATAYLRFLEAIRETTSSNDTGQAR